MTVTCWAPGCRSGYDRKTGERHFFSAPTDPKRLEEWRRRIPLSGVLTSKHKICDIHFDDRFIVKSDNFTIDGQVVSFPRAAWRLTPDAVPTIFPNLPKYLSTNVPKKRRSPRRGVLLPIQQNTDDIENCTSFDVCGNEAPDFSEVSGNACAASKGCSASSKRMSGVPCSKCKILTNRLYVRNRQIRLKNRQIRSLRKELNELTVEHDKLKKKTNSIDQLPIKSKHAVSEMLKTSNTQTSHGIRYSSEWIVDALLIKCKSTSCYKFLRQHNYLPLPSPTTLSRSIQNFSPTFGFDRAVLASLKEKLKDFPLMERRGMLLFDEMQVSKHVDFRLDLCKNVGFVDFGQHTTALQMQQEGYHALVFLFHPHLSGWMQTIGCFCSAGTTPSLLLSKLIVEAILVLENCGAHVHGIVCDGAATNRKAMKLLGMSGKIGEVSNKMCNPFDDSRSVYFVCDAPHLLKTVRNNLLQQLSFLTPQGMVKLDHYRLLVEHDLNLSTGLRAVPKVNRKHVSPNNFQKMSVKIAAQLFSKSVADGLCLYQQHVPGLSDATSTIAFTRRMNDVFDLLNCRHPNEAVRLNSQRDKLKEIACAETWLDDWEKYVSENSVKQRLFLSRQTAEGLRITLRSVRELAGDLLQSGYKYVLTGKFNQDALEMFFGMVRQSCGADDHPTPNQFLYVYRLLSFSSLVKSPARASVQSAPVAVLATGKSAAVRKPEPTLVQLQKRIHRLLEKSNNADVCNVSGVVGSRLTDLTYATAVAGSELLPDDDLDELMLASCETDDLLLSCDVVSVVSDDDTESDADCNLTMTCSADGCLPDDCVMYYVAGYIAFKLKKTVSCAECVSTVSDRCSSQCAEAKLVRLRSYGGLQFPSEKLLALLKVAENCIDEIRKR